MSYRTQIIERDFSGFVLPSVTETGGMVVISPKGKGNIPILCSSETDVVTNFGTPSAEYPSLFEAVAFCRQAPCYIVSAIGDNSLYGGVEIKEDEVISIVSGASDVSSYSFSGEDVALALFASSQYSTDLRVNVITQGGTKFKATLYNRVSGNDIYLKEYNFSLVKEKDAFGRSLYFEDVFNEDPYIIPKYNSATTASDFSGLVGTTSYNLGGGSRGDTPDATAVSTAYTLFNSANKYPLNMILDPFGGYATDLNNIIQTYQKYAHGISVVPLGNTAAQMVTYRNSLGLDTDNISLYANWAKIVDPYNNSFAWVSNVGSIGAKYALMEDVFDGLSPAGVDENNHGGQIQVWRPIEVEVDFSDANLRSLDEAQINPFILDEIYGLHAAGDKTLQVSLSDTSYVGTRRLYNLILKTVSTQILRKQEFKNNDEPHRYRAKSMTEDFLSPIVGLGLFREVAVICDESNNTDEVLQQRRFVLDIVVKITPNSQFVTLRLNRLSQTQTIAEFLS